MSIQGYPEGDVQTGERILVSPLTGQPYIVTKWVERGGNRFVAIDKRPIEDRLFVPLNSEPWYAFESGSKDTELRGYNANFNMKTVVPGRWVELRRGYSTNDSLWGVIEYVHHFLHIPNIPEALDHRRIMPDATEAEFIDRAEKLLTDYSTYIAFKIRLVRFGFDGRGSEE